MLNVPPLHAVPAWQDTPEAVSDVTKQQIEPLAQSPVSSQPSDKPVHDVPIPSHVSVADGVPCARQQKFDGTSQGAAPHVTTPGSHGAPPSGTTHPASEPLSGVPVSIAASCPPSRVAASVEVSVAEPSRGVEDSGCTVPSVPVSG